MPSGPNADTSSIMSAKKSGRPKPTSATVTNPRVNHAQNWPTGSGGNVPPRSRNSLSCWRRITARASSFAASFELAEPRQVVIWMSRPAELGAQLANSLFPRVAERGGRPLRGRTVYLAATANHPQTINPRDVIGGTGAERV
jgi:hypothetical protein